MTPAPRELPRRAPSDPRAAVPVPAGRFVLASLLVTYIALGPFVVQVLGVETELLLRWTMFNTEVNRMCLVEYRAASPDGSTARVDRYAWLGITDPALAPPEVALIRSPEQAVEVGRRLCRERPGVELRVLARCPRAGAWEIALRGEADLCAASGAPR